MAAAVVASGSDLWSHRKCMPWYTSVRCCKQTSPVIGISLVPNNNVPKVMPVKLAPRGHGDRWTESGTEPEKYMSWIIWKIIVERWPLLAPQAMDKKKPKSAWKASACQKKAWNSKQKPQNAWNIKKQPSGVINIKSMATYTGLLAQQNITAANRLWQSLCLNAVHGDMLLAACYMM